MSSRGTFLGDGFGPNLVRLAFLLVLLAFFLGPMRALYGTAYQWLSLVIGAFLALSVIALFVGWKAFAFCATGFLATNLAGAFIMSQQAETRAARAAYVDSAGRDAAYTVLFPDALQAWLSEFTPGSAGGNSTFNERPFNGQQRFISRAGNAYDPSSVYYLATSDLAMTDRSFVQSYRQIAEQHGDWLGYMARCVHAGGSRVPLLPDNRSALKDAERTGRSICSAAYAEQAFGIDIEEARTAYLSRLGVSNCSESRACERVKSDLKSYGGTFFPE